MTTLLKYIGYNRPNEVVEVENDKVADLMATGQYALVEDMPAVDMVAKVDRKRK